MLTRAKCGQSLPNNMLHSTSLPPPRYGRAAGERERWGSSHQQVTYVEY